MGQDEDQSCIIQPKVPDSGYSNCNIKQGMDKSLRLLNKRTDQSEAREKWGREVL